MKMDKNTKRIITIATVAFIAFAAIAYAITVWRWTTKITVLEPFEVKTNLPTEISLYPGSYGYWINVTNHGEENLGFMLYYTITKENCDVSVSPLNGTSYKVAAGGTVSIPIKITVSIDGYSNGTATINWWIERV
jgi:glycopeptide antibiotics resistance protein